MPLESTRWNGGDTGEDVHILRGQAGPDLSARLVVKQVGVAAVFANAVPAGVAVTFTGLFAGAPAAHGASVAAASGVVTATALPVILPPLLPPPVLRNFLIEATVTEGAVVMRQHIRVHIHNALTDVWITPSSLTVRQNATAVRLSVMARFDDGVIGDITDWALLPAAHLSRLQWQASTPLSCNVAADGTLAPLIIGGPFRVDVGVGAAPFVAAFSANANVTVAAPWSTPTTLTFVSGAGAARVATAPNLLFLPDGFTSRADFDRFVRQVVTKLTSRQVLRPFDLLANELNFWSAWVPSVDAGISTRAELGAVTRTSGANRRQSEVPYPEAPPAAAATWTLEQLIHQVGLPIPSDAGRPLTGGVDPILPEWVTLFGAQVTAARVTGVYADWLALHQRTFIDDRNTAFRMFTGSRPRVREVPHRRVSLGIETADLDVFLNQLTFPAQGRIGVTWGGGAGGPAGLTPGKDSQLICILSLTARNGGSNHGHFFAVALGVAPDHLTSAAAAPSRGRALVAPAVPARPLLDTVGSVGHESAHSLTLLDEYGGAATTPAGTTFPNDANVQEDTAVRVGANLVGANIKWRWHRIEHAGVTASPVIVMGANFRVDLRAGHAAGFAVGNVIRLRTRPLLSSTVSAELEIVSIAADAIELRDGTGAFAPVIATFAAGSVFMRVVRSTVAPNPEQRLVAASVEAHLNGQPHPLNAPRVPAAGRVCTPNNADMLPATFINAALQARVAAAHPRFSAWLVGLYEGGATFSCGTFHPTGTCLMRQIEIATVSGTLYQFCTVCRYALVDLLDPRQHGVIDRDYAPRYPDP